MLFLLCLLHLYISKNSSLVQSSSAILSSEWQEHIPRRETPPCPFLETLLLLLPLVFLNLPGSRCFAQCTEIAQETGFLTSNGNTKSVTFLKPSPHQTSTQGVVKLGPKTLVSTDLKDNPCSKELAISVAKGRLSPVYSGQSDAVSD